VVERSHQPVNATEFPEEYCGVRGGQGRPSEEVSALGFADFADLARLFAFVGILAGLVCWFRPS